MQLPDKYADIKELKPGQNAQVFSALDTLLNRPMFLKVYKIPDDDPNSALREPQMLEALAHENLTKIFSADHLETEHLLLGMELLTGGSYNDQIEASLESGHWASTHQVINLICDAVNGLGHLHRSGFVHRDVKPANLMRRIVGGQEQGAVTDLGLASRLTEDGKAYASKHARLYRPPEVWEGHGYTPTSDLYQMGIVLYQMLGGQLNYSMLKLSDNELAKIITQYALLDWGTLPPFLSRGLLRVIKRCVGLPQQRFPDAPKMIVELHNLRNREPDWSYEINAGNKIFLRKDGGGRQIRFTVCSAGATHTVTREKRVAGGSFRRDGKSISFTHKDLGSCREFSKLINS